MSNTSSLPAIVAPSMLSADLANLVAESKRVIEAGADWLHLDVMDGHFVPNLTFGAPVVQCLKKHMSPSTVLDCHLMVSDPERWIVDFQKAGATNFTFHIEAAKERGQDPKVIIDKIVAAGMKPGIAVKPGTPIDTIFPYCPHLYCVIVMTVEPGFSGQSFMPAPVAKVRQLRERFPHLHIELDGGIAADTVEIVAKEGANAVVAGSGVFGQPDIKVAIAVLKQKIQEQQKLFKPSAAAASS